MILTMSEFGRMARENGTGGTDHGHAGAMFVIGGSVKGGKVHGKWPGLEREQLYEGRDLALTTDFRSVFGEIASRHLGASRARRRCFRATVVRACWLALGRCLLRAGWLTVWLRPWSAGARGASAAECGSQPASPGHGSGARIELRARLRCGAAQHRLSPLAPASPRRWLRPDDHAQQRARLARLARVTSASHSHRVNPHRSRWPSGLPARTS